MASLTFPGLSGNYAKVTLFRTRVSPLVTEGIGLDGYFIIVESMPAKSRFDFDIYISYATADDRDSVAGEWVGRFVEDLSSRLHMMAGRPPRIWVDKLRLQITDNFMRETENAVTSSALFLPVFSPSFLSSNFCMKELALFNEVADPSRIVKVVKYPAPEKYPYPDIVEHRFYRLTTESIAQELRGDRYRQAINQLAHQIILLLNSISGHKQRASSVQPMIVFLCHSSGDKAAVRNLWQRLTDDGFVPWLDEKTLLPGQRWEIEIRKAIDAAGAIIVCISRTSVNKKGFLQREIRMVLDKASEKPDDVIFLIPARLEECVVPPRLEDLQWVDLFHEDGYSKHRQALQTRAAPLE